MARLLLYGVLLFAILVGLIVVVRAIGSASRATGQRLTGDAAPAEDPTRQPWDGAVDPRSSAVDPPPPPGLAAGWYPEPGTGRHRWWDGTAWTDAYR